MKRFILSHKRKKSESSGGSGPLLSDLVSLGILTKPIAEFSNSDIGTTVLIPYTDSSGKILLNDGNIEFEVVGVNHHTSAAHQQTITLMTKNIIRNVAFDVAEPNNPLRDPAWENGMMRASGGNNRWSVSNIRQWLNSSGAANSWFKPQHDYDEAPTSGNVYNAGGAYADAPGFLAGFGVDVLQHFTDITNITALPNVDRVGSETSETTVDKVFLPSYTEMTGYNNEGVAEGVHLSGKYSSGDKESASRVKSGTDSRIYWMRSPAYIDSFKLWCVYPDGSCIADAAYGCNTGIAPIIVLH